MDERERIARRGQEAARFDVIPAIDLLDGQVVRLRQGSYDDVTTYARDPAAIAGEYAAAGVDWLHVVDLDGARDGRPSARNRAALGRMIEVARGVRIQLGGGLRDAAAAADALACGASAVVVGTAAFEDPASLDALLNRVGDALCVAADARDGLVQVAGWRRSAGVRVEDAVRELATRGVRSFLVTAIERDGVGSGHDVAQLARLRAVTSARLIASGGIGSADDIAACRAVGADGVVVGKALLDGRVSLDDVRRESCRNSA